MQNSPKNRTERLRAGVLGTGKISAAYLNHARTFSDMEIIACADVRPEAAEAKAAEFGLEALTVDQLLADERLDLIINLTLPQTHASINRKILEAGKHAYSEKPFGVDFEEAVEVNQLATKLDLRVGCAPDTFLGGGQQMARKLVDDGWIGDVIAGTAFMMNPGPESWHPNPGFYYLKGGGPLLDMGPYYLTTLVNLLGPVESVVGMSRRSDSRLATCKEFYGEYLPVEVDTHVSAVLHFASGAIITLVMSFDVKGHGHAPIELYGTRGSLNVPDPNTFGGPVRIRYHRQEAVDVPLAHGYTENMRSIGAADLAAAVRQGRPHRASGDLALHVLDIMISIDRAASTGEAIRVKTTCQRPAALPLGLLPGTL